MNIECTPAMAQVLTEILRIESIRYTLGYGARSIVVIIDQKDMKNAKRAIAEWKDAIVALNNQIRVEDARNSDRAWRRSQE